jgi:hypothetical protein
MASDQPRHHGRDRLGAWLIINVLAAVGREHQLVGDPASGQGRLLKGVGL